MGTPVGTAQHVDTGEVLMQAFADRAAISETLQVLSAPPPDPRPPPPPLPYLAAAGLGQWWRCFWVSCTTASGALRSYVVAL